MSARSILRAGFEAIERQLAPLGFKPDEMPGFFRMDVAPGVSGSVLLGRWTEDGVIYVHPNVGVRHDGVEAVFYNLMDWDDVVLMDTVLSPLYDLIGTDEYRKWSFSQDANTESEARSLAVAVRLFALPFIQQASTLRGAIEALRQHRGEHVAYRLPIAIALAGDPSGARREVQEQLAKGPAFDILGPGSYPTFAERFWGLFGKDEATGVPPMSTM